MSVRRRSQILNSNYTDATFDRLTALCQRIFKVPIAFVSLLDANRKWFKSNMGKGLIESDVNSSFCVYTILPESADVFIVADTLSDERFSSNHLVTGFPFIRFYAGAAIVVEGVRIGTICIIDSNARHNFTLEDRMNLLDLSATAASLIISQRNAMMSIHSIQASNETNDQSKSYVANNIIIDKNNLMVDVMHQVRTPLMGIQLNTSLLESNYLELADYLKEDTHGNALTNNMSTSLSDLKSSISQLDTFATSSLQLKEYLFHSEYEKSSTDAKIVPTQLQFNDLFSQIKSSLSLISKSTDIEWNIHEKLTDAIIVSHPDIITFVICSLMARAVAHWKNANITIHLKNNHTLIVDDNSQLLEMDNKYIIKNYLFITINISQPKPIITLAKNINNTDHLIIDLQSIVRLLFEIGGEVRSFNFDASTSSSYFESNQYITEQLFEVTIPCDLCSSTDDNYNYETKIVNNDDLIRNKKVELSFDDENLTNDFMGFASFENLQNTKVNSFRDDNEMSKFDYKNNENEKTAIVDDEKYLTNIGSDSNNPLRVLLVDDSIIIYKVLKRWLEVEGCDVTIAENGKIALSYLKSQSFDITIIDFVMPVMSGKETMKQFQEWKLELPYPNNINEDMLLIGMSANASQIDQAEAYQYGMHFFALKPVDLDFLSIILSTKSKRLSLAKVITEITINASKTNEHSTSINPMCIQKKADLILRSSSSSSKYNYQKHAVSISNSNSNSNIIGTTDIVTTQDNNIKANLQTSKLSTGNSFSVLRRFRDNIFSQFFRDCLSSDSKILPSANEEVH